MLIQWRDDNNIQSHIIAYGDGGNAFRTEFSENSSNSFHLIFPDKTFRKVGFKYADTIVNLGIQEYTDPTLSIISPNGGEKLASGSMQTITWDYTGFINTVHLQWSSDNGQNWQTIAANTDNDKSYGWTVPFVNSSNCKIKIFEPSDSLPVDESNISFTIGARPILYDTTGLGGDLTASLQDNGNGIVDIFYQVFDPDSTSNPVAAQYRIGAGGTWVGISNSSGDIGAVTTVDSSVHRHIVWNAKTQLSTSFDSDEVQLRLIVSDPVGLPGDTLAMANANLVLDFKAPDTVTALQATPASPNAINLTWNVSSSADAASQLIIRGTVPIASIADTVGKVWQVVGATVDSIYADGLTSNTIYYFAVYTADEVPNWNQGSATYTKTPNIPPTCVISDITTEQSEDVSIRFTLQDTELDSLSITCSYSIDGSTWSGTTISGVPATIHNSLYAGGKELTAIWATGTILPTVNTTSLSFVITPSDQAAGQADTVEFSLDNYHGHAISVTTPSTIQTGDVPIAFVVSDTSGDSIALSCEYSINGGTTWQSTQNYDVKKVGPAGYSGNLIWNSTSDIGDQSIETMQFRVTPNDGWKDGLSGKTENFHVNNVNIPLTVKLLEEPNNEDGKVAIIIGITAPAYDSVVIDSALYSVNGAPYEHATMLTSTTIIDFHFDSSRNIWDSKKDFTSNAEQVTVKLVIKADTHRQSVVTNPFSLHNNEAPSITVSELQGVQSGDIDISYSLADTDLDTLNIIASYSEDGTTWHRATISGDTSGIDSSRYTSRRITWHSMIDFVNALQKNILFAITPFDLDTGTADTISFTLTNENAPPQVQITSLVQEQSGNVSLNFTLSDDDRDTLSILCKYSSDGNAWSTTTLSGIPAKISDSLYHGKELSAVWQSGIACPNRCIDTLHFKIIPSDLSFGVHDTIMFPLDNFHAQSISLTTPSGEQSGDVSIPFVVTDTSSDTITLASSFSLDGGMSWQETQNVNLFKVGSLEYSNAIIWHSVSDLSTANFPAVRFKIVPFDGWQDGVTGVSNSFVVNNSVIPLVVNLLQQPKVQADTVNCAVKILTPSSSFVTIDKAQYSIAGGTKKSIAALVTGDTIYREDFDSALVVWASKQDFSSNASGIKLFFTFKTDTSAQSIVTDSFTLNNNEIPKISLPTISGVQKRSVTIPFTITDKDYDTISCIIRYSEDGSLWKKATVLGDSSNIDSSRYTSAKILWQSQVDLPKVDPTTVWFKIVPYDQDTGTYDSIQITIDNRPVIAGDFNSDRVVDFYDFSYVSEYWYKSARGVTHPDSIQELYPFRDTIPYITVTGDSLFDYQDLAVFVQMFYWSKSHLPLKYAEPTFKNEGLLANSVTASITASTEKTVTISTKALSVTELVSCNFVVQYDPETFEFTTTTSKQGILAQNGADIFSQVNESLGTTSIGVARLSSKSCSVSGSGLLSDITFKRKNREASTISINYSLINENHQLFTSGTISVAIPAMAQEKSEIFVSRNPSYTSGSTVPLKFTENVSLSKGYPRQGFLIWVKKGDELQNTPALAQLCIFDALGNIVNTIEATDITVSGGEYFNAYWSGHNRNGRKVGAGTYKVVVDLYYNGRSERLSSLVGVKHR